MKLIIFILIVLIIAALLEPPRVSWRVFYL